MIPKNPMLVGIGLNHLCLLSSTKNVVCMGSNEYGQKNGMNLPVTLPTAVRTNGNPSMIAVGDSHTCAVISPRSVQCWGNNDDGQLGK